MATQQWFLFEGETDYKKGITRFEQVRTSKKGTREHKEKLLLAYLINQYEQKKWSLPAVDPVELIKIRRLFSKILHIPADILSKKYRLQ